MISMNALMAKIIVITTHLALTSLEASNANATMATVETVSIAVILMNVI